MNPYPCITLKGARDVETQDVLYIVIELTKKLVKPLWKSKNNLDFQGFVKNLNKKS